MRYNGDYEKIVSDSISLAITNLNTCKLDTAEIPSIPSDFERIQDINNVITGINNIKLDDINSEIESFIESSEEMEILNYALARLLKNPYVIQLKDKMNNYLFNNQYRSKDEIIQAYKTGKIRKAQYDYYTRIWNLSLEELVELSKNLRQEDMDVILRVRSMNQKESSEMKLLNDFLNFCHLPTIKNQNITKLEWILEHRNRDNQYGIDQGIYKQHIWYEYETEDGSRIIVVRNSPQYFEAIKNEKITLIPVHDEFIEERVKSIHNRYPNMTYKQIEEIIEMIDNPRKLFTCYFS